MSIATKEAQFKVGQKVRIMGPRAAFGNMSCPVGMIGIVTLNDGEGCRVEHIQDNGGLDDWYYKHSSLAPADAPEARRPQVGDRVRVRCDSINVLLEFLGKEGKITYEAGGIFTVRFAGGDTQYATSHDLDLLIDQGTLTHNGKTYAVTEEAGGRLILTPLPERTPRQGEVWRDSDGDLFLVTDLQDEDGINGVYLTGPVGEWNEVIPDEGDTFAFESVTAAVAAGALN